MIGNSNESSKYVSTIAEREDLDVFSKGGTPMKHWLCCIFPQQSRNETEPWETRHVKVESYPCDLTEEKNSPTKVISSKNSEDGDTPQQETVINGSPTSTLEWPPQIYLSTHEEPSDSSDVHMTRDDSIQDLTEEECSRDTAGNSMEFEQAELSDDFCERSLPWLASMDQEDICIPTSQKLETVSEEENDSEEEIEKDGHLPEIMMDCDVGPQEEVEGEHCEDLAQNSKKEADSEPTDEQVQTDTYDVTDRESTENTDATEEVVDTRGMVHREELEETREECEAPLGVSEPPCQVEHQEALDCEPMQPKSDEIVEEAAALEQIEEKKLAFTLAKTNDSPHQDSDRGDVASSTATECSPKVFVPDMVQSYGSFDFSCSSSEDMTGLDVQPSKLTSIGEETVLLKETPESSKVETVSETSSFNVLLAVSWVAVSLFALQGHELYEKYC